MRLTKEDIELMQNDIMDTIYDINYGGCIQFAYFFSRRLVKLRINHKLVFVDNRKVYLSLNHFRSVNHVMVYIPTIGYIDGQEIVSTIKDRNCGKYYRSSRPVLKRIDRYRREGDWNSSYSLTQNRKLEKIIDKHTKLWRKRFMSENMKQL